MLDWRLRLTFVLVALSLPALHTVVTAAKREPSAPGAVSQLAPNATQSEDIQQSINSQEPSPMAKFKSGITGPARYRNNNPTAMSNGSVENPQDLSYNALNTSKRNRSKKAGRKDRQRTAFWSEDIQVGCRELRARSYITDGFCTSEKPVKEVVCAGHCLPIMDMPWYAEFVKQVATTKLRDWQCVEDVVQKKRVKLVCQDGSPRHYKIKVVKSCKCKKITNKHNKTSHKQNRTEQKKKTNVQS